MTKQFAYLGDDTIGSFVRAQLEQAGYSMTATPANAEVVFVYCFHSSAVEDFYFEDSGLVNSVNPNTLLVNLSPATPALGREIAAISMVNDVHSVEAPLCVESPFAHDALSKENLFCYVGGETADCEKAQEYLELLVGRTVMTGDCGSAQLAKAMHTTNQASRVVAAVEELALFTACKDARFARYKGFVPDILNDSFVELVAASRDSKLYHEGIASAHIMADVFAAMATADDSGIILPQLEAAQHILELFGLIGGADLGVSSLALLFGDEDAGAEAGLDWERAADYYDQYNHQSYGDDEEEGFDFGDGIDYYAN